MRESVFSELSDVDRALEILSGNDEFSRSHKGPEGARAKSAIALAFLNHGVSAAMQLTEIKLKRPRGEARLNVREWTPRLFVEGQAKRT